MLMKFHFYANRYSLVLIASHVDTSKDTDPMQTSD